jgi:hypothetical protein
MEFWEKGTAKIPPCYCLQCGHRFNASSSLSGHGNDKRAGQLVVCICCGAVMIHNDDLTVRALNAEEVAEVSSDSVLMHELAKHVGAVHLYRAGKN